MVGEYAGGLGLGGQQGDKLVSQPWVSLLLRGGSWTPLSPGREDNEGTQPASQGL